MVKSLLRHYETMWIGIPITDIFILYLYIKHFANSIQEEIQILLKLYLAYHTQFSYIHCIIWLIAIWKQHGHDEYKSVLISKASL